MPPRQTSSSKQAQRPIKKLRRHPQAELVPPMGEPAYTAFRDHIATHGIREPLEITSAGVLINGYQRLRAAIELELKQVPVRVIGPAEDPVEYMLSAAIQRRDLTKTQKAILALELDSYQQQRTSAEQRKRANLRNSGVDVAALTHRAGRSREHAAKIAGVSERLIQNAIAVGEKAPDLYELARAGELSAEQALGKIKQRANHATARKPRPLPKGRFGVLYVDAPWQSQSPGSKWSPEQHYPTMPVAQIKRLAVPAADDSVLFLWAVSALLPEALEVMQAWGFEYRSNIVWDKLSIGLGVWVRHEHELLLIGRRGNQSPPERTRRVRSIIRARRGRHSEKPQQFYELLEQMYPEQSKLELFARRARPGWTSWGNQLDQQAAA
jgi:N6-adenosine-specific RNA methylase IME4/ParB-like chromosome segregation protein Spo0J